MCDIFARIPKEAMRFRFRTVVSGARLRRRVGIDVVVAEQIIRGLRGRFEEIDGFEENVDHKKSDFDLDEDDAAPSSSSSSSNRGVPKLILRVSMWKLMIEEFRD